jgi:hypothetical protein
VGSGQQRTSWVFILGIVLGIAGVVLVLILAFPLKINHNGNKQPFPPPAIPESQQTVKMRLFFGSATLPGLAVEARQIVKLSQLTDQVGEVVTQLLKGPQAEGLVATIPEGTRLRGVYIDQAGCAYVDFSGHLSRNHPGGSYAELQTVYSVVNTLTSNFEPIKMVKILVDGAEIDTLAGHVDTRYPMSFQQL